MNTPGAFQRFASRLATEMGLDRLAKRSARQDEILERLLATVTQIEARLDRVDATVGSYAPRMADIEAIRRDLSRLRQRTDELEHGLGRRGLGGHLRRISQDVRALLRLELIDADELPYPYRLFARRANLVSQNEEDGMALAIFEHAGAQTRTFVDIGSGAAGGVAAVFAREFGWKGLMIDGNGEHVQVAKERFGGAVTVLEAFVTRENVNELLTSHGFTGEIDLFNLDIDGIDYWIWDALEAIRPRVVVVEYNALLGLDRAVTVPYTPTFNRHEFSPVMAKRYFGASLPAFCHLATRRGYRLVATDSSAINAFFLRADVAEDIPELPLTALPYRVSDIGKHEDLFTLAAEQGLTFVDVSRETM